MNKEKQNAKINLEEELSFPNVFEKDILRYRSKNLFGTRESIFGLFLKNSRIKSFTHEILRNKRYHGLSYISSTLSNKERMMPDFMIPGFPRCGSTSLWNILNQHPKVFGIQEKEPHFFSYGFSEGLKKYQKNYPLKKISDSMHCFEASQSYLHDRFSMKRIFDLIPKMKFIVSLRNPIEKLFSTYNQLKNSFFEIDSLEDCINNESDRFLIWDKRHEMRILKTHNIGMCPPYLYLATYVKHLKNAFKYFPKEQFLFIDFKNLKDSPQDVATKCFEFLDISSVDIRPAILNKQNYSEKISNDLRTRLREYFEPYNLELEELLNHKFNWK